MLTAEQSVVSMTREQVAESLEITMRDSNNTHGRGHDDAMRLISEDGYNLALKLGPRLLRANKSSNTQKRKVASNLILMADELMDVIEYQKRRLVYLRAVELIEEA